MAAGLVPDASLRRPSQRRPSQWGPFPLDRPAGAAVQTEEPVVRALYGGM